MRFIATVIFVAVLGNAYGQASLYGKKQEGPLTLEGGKQVSVGDTIHFGRGTMPGGDFKYIQTPANAIVGLAESSLPHQWGGRFAIVNAIRTNETKRFGKKTYVVVSAGRNAMIEIEPAIEVGEVVAINSQSVKTKNATNSSSTVSVADELIKLKQLLDAGAISQGEYDQQKKKLLNP
ncbi:SHOCT domain-containing protein [Spirosoma sordidisoli]|uniref:SHOCT domain-containing protein n=1 Tax=Spirosoma sordidisoli TaxID=2502893 RepID=A0A4Q2UN66_9BACT|nr:SHOCT domain-containing protein [Spirosoma sordidisoli]RYC70854.1 SHOCT domain-containing protein [Spirosoma sordidisoli]